MQTESHTPIDTDMTCFEKAKAHGEPTFTLRAQDITSDLVVDFWTIVQIRVKENMDAGLTMMQAVQAVRSYFFLESVNSPRYPKRNTGTAKLATAVLMADEMRQWPDRKLAD